MLLLPSSVPALAPEVGTMPVDFLIASSPPPYFGEWGTILALPFSVSKQTLKVPRPQRPDTTLSSSNCAATSLQFLPSGPYHTSWGSSELLEPVRTLSWPYSSLFLMHPALNSQTNCSKIQMLITTSTVLKVGLHISLWSGCCPSFLYSSHLQSRQWLLRW